LGDRISVQVARVYTVKKQVDFCLVKTVNAAKVAPKTGARPAEPRRQPAPAQRAGGIPEKLMFKTSIRPIGGGGRGGGGGRRRRR
jgi:hypothetical protein